MSLTRAKVAKFCRLLAVLSCAAMVVLGIFCLSIDNGRFYDVDGALALWGCAAFGFLYMGAAIGLICT